MASPCCTWYNTNTNDIGCLPVSSPARFAAMPGANLATQTPSSGTGRVTLGPQCSRHHRWRLGGLGRALRSFWWNGVPVRHDIRIPPVPCWHGLQRIAEARAGWAHELHVIDLHGWVFARGLRLQKTQWSVSWISAMRMRRGWRSGGGVWGGSSTGNELFVFYERFTSVNNCFWFE